MILRAIEDRRLLPVGFDKEAVSGFQLIAGTNRDLGEAAGAGAFHDDLYARPTPDAGWRQKRSPPVANKSYGVRTRYAFGSISCRLSLSYSVFRGIWSSAMVARISPPVSSSAPRSRDASN